ncbi:hypothetical protein F7725_024787, partial [Dissostichus mawsoni]
MKRRNADCSKLRRPVKRNRITEGIYSSTFLYLKFLVVWVLVLLADFVLEFRFEYLWPFWLFIRSVYDSFRYQGLAFSVFFVCVAFTSDIICLLFIPVQWLFFAASTYVWVQYVWHTERGVCLPTVSLWILFVYIEAAIRFKDLKNFHVDLCRPFAAHCIGYPVVTLGFGFKSYVSYKMRLRKQKEVEPAVVSQNGSAPAKKSPSVPLPELEYREKGKDSTAKEGKKQNSVGINNNSIVHALDSKVQETEYIENYAGAKRLNNDLAGDSTHTETNTHSASKEEMGSTGKNYKNASEAGETFPTRRHGITVLQMAVCRQVPRPIRTRRSKGGGERAEGPGGELHSQQPAGQARRPRTAAGVGAAQSGVLSEQLHSAVQAKQKDKQTISQLEKRLKAEQEARTLAEKQLAEERKRKKMEDATAARAVALAAATRVESTDSLRGHIRELEMECKKLSMDLKLKEEQIRDLEGKCQDKTQHLENSLSAETRIKLDLFSALGDAKRQLEIAQGQIHKREQEIAELKQKIAEVMAVMPSLSYSSDSNNMSPVTPHYSSKFMDNSPLPGPQRLSLPAPQE